MVKFFAPAHSGRSTPKIRVMFVAHDSQLYGAQLALLDILQNLDRSKFTPTVVAPQSGPFTEKVAQLGITVVTGVVMRWIYKRSPISLASLLRTPWRLCRAPAIYGLFLCGLPVRVARLLFLFHRLDIDVVYTNTITVFDGAIAARISRRPHIWHLHEQIDANKEILKLFPGKWISRTVVPKFSSRIIVASCALRAKLFPGDYATSKITVIHNGVDTKLFRPHQSEHFLHSELSVATDVRLIGICGAIQEDKGLEVFIRAAAEVAKTHPTAQFVVIGDGHESYIDHLHELVRKVGLEDKVHFIGWRSEVSAIFCELEMIVIASMQEAFGRTAIEAMAVGKPVVSTRCGGPEEVINHGKTGFLVDIDDHNKLASRISELLSNQLLAHEMGLAGRIKVEKSFSVQDIAEGVEKIISSSVRCNSL